MQTMYLALGIFLLTYVLMLTLQKYRPTIALSSALIFIVLGLCGVFDFRPLDALAAVDYNVLLMIAGTMGLVNAQVAKAFGARVMISDISPKKIARAKEMGIDVIDAKNTDPVQAVKDLTDGKGADTVIAAVGSTLAYKQGYEMLKHFRGKLVIFPAGYPKPELQVDPNELHYRKLEIIGSFVANLTDWYESATLISKRLIDCSYSLEGKYIPLRDIQKAYEAAATPDAYRVTVDLQGV